ncbi:hypothetical protein PMIN06_002062 [Paraphaeosphaeria minitans]
MEQRPCSLGSAGENCRIHLQLTIMVDTKSTHLQLHDRVIHTFCRRYLDPATNFWHQLQSQKTRLSNENEYAVSSDWNDRRGIRRLVISCSDGVNTDQASSPFTRTTSAPSHPIERPCPLIRAVRYHGSNMFTASPATV